MSERPLREHFETLRAKEFSRLDECRHVYLDYTGSGLYAASQLRNHEEYLRDRVFGNPHSESPASAMATELVERARREVLEFFNADPDEYMVVFTANASSALKLVGEAYPFEGGSRLVMLEDNHNSVQGIRLYAEAKGAEVSFLSLDERLRMSADQDFGVAGTEASLFAFPAQSNFSGVKHPLSLVAEAKGRGFDVVLDAAAFVPTSALDLDAVRPDFTCVSFYKMLGFPTGVGALIARKNALARLRRPWFAGGTVEYVSVQGRTHRLRLGAEAFEDGTLNFLGIIAIPPGLAFLRNVGMDRIRARVEGLTGRLLEILSGLRHDEGSAAVELYGPETVEDRGGTVSFNLLDSSGGVVPYGAVERAASRHNISLRGGCFCNPGAAEAAFGLPGDESVRCFESLPHGAFSLKDLAACLDHKFAVGALRASVGIATNEADLDRLEVFLSEFVAEYAEDAGRFAAD
jgi:selenocysteine lyase/cysteine desulfurase